MAEVTAELVMVFLAGLAGSFHCVGMCGGFTCALAVAAPARATMIARHLAYNGGRVITYAFLGALAGAFGRVVCTADGVTAVLPAEQLQRLLAVAAGGLMVVMAAGLLGMRRRWGPKGFDLGPVAAMLRPLLVAPGPTGSLALGVVNGFLPCPLVYALVAKAASGADAATGAMTMLAFGLGTVPALAVIGGLGRYAGPAALRRGVAVAGWFVLALGIVTIGRGVLPILHGHAA
ncbi:MAG TPA: sulfite exporter TauE/SafE family protein [Candidatus Omnitrophota bacterium]|nr:sulfite exporter TauE/SafE family protein [Candidatus Omnitrophota bacterium]